MSADHTIYNEKSGCLECKHCGFRGVVKMPIPLGDMVSLMDAFTTAHKGCVAPIAETVMSDYIKGFDHGCDYIVNEIKHWSEQHQYDVVALLAHLEGEGGVKPKNR